MTETAEQAGLADYPQEFVQRYRASGLWSMRTIAQQFRATADAMPDRTAVIGLSGRLTYAELDEQTDRIAVGLRAAGLQPGERVLLQVNNDMPAVLACCPPGRHRVHGLRSGLAGRRDRGRAAVPAGPADHRSWSG